jgi:hypothetical protein
MGIIINFKENIRLEENVIITPFDNPLFTQNSIAHYSRPEDGLALVRATIAQLNIH